MYFIHLFKFGIHFMKALTKHCIEQLYDVQNARSVLFGETNRAYLHIVS